MNYGYVVFGIIVVLVVILVNYFDKPTIDGNHRNDYEDDM